MSNGIYCNNTPSSIPLTLIAEHDWTEKKPQIEPTHRTWLDHADFQGRLSDQCCIYDTKGALSAVYIGTGKEHAHEAMAKAAERLPEGCYHSDDALDSLSLLYWGMAQYRFDRYKKEDTKYRCLCITAAREKEAMQVLQAVQRARDLINTPTSDMGPAELSACMQSIAQTHQAEFEEWVGDALLADNFPAIHAVGRASNNAPRLLHLRWGDVHAPLISLVGKGVCFDSGGLDIKPSSGMRLMKKDMGGAAQAIALAEWIMAKGLALQLHLWVPAVENSISGNAYRPGDVLTMRNGTTVEIDNTDAEGRLVLADAMVKACEYQPSLLVDFATLTGAARVAVGTDIAAMFANHEETAAQVLQASSDCNDPIWQLPLYANYNSMLDSHIADMVNSASTGYAGAITAGLFLSRFVPETIPWLHFDLMAWNLHKKPGKPVGGEAMAIRAVMQHIESLSAKAATT